MESLDRMKITLVHCFLPSCLITLLTRVDVSRGDRSKSTSSIHNTVKNLSTRENSTIVPGHIDFHLQQNSYTSNCCLGNDASTAYTLRISQKTEGHVSGYPSSPSVGRGIFFAASQVGHASKVNGHTVTRLPPLVSTAASVGKFSQLNSKHALKDNKHRILNSITKLPTKNQSYKRVIPRRITGGIQQPEFVSPRNIIQTWNQTRKTLSRRHVQSTIKENRKANFYSSRTAFQTSNLALNHNALRKTDHSHDDYKVDLSLDEVRHYPVPFKDNECSIVVNGSSGVIYLTGHKTSKRRRVCNWKIYVEKNHFIAARIQTVEQNCAGGRYNIYIEEYLTRKRSYTCSQETLIYTGSQGDFKVYVEYARNVTAFYLFFTTVTRDGNLFLPATMTSSTTGYVTSVGYGSKAHYSRCARASHKLTVPYGHLVMLSFLLVKLDVRRACKDSVSLYTTSNNTDRLVLRVCGGDHTSPQLSNTSLVIIMKTDSAGGDSGFKMAFSFHPASVAPLRNDEGLWNCSGSNYLSFKQHVHCNLNRDCVGGEDEWSHCPFSSPLCNGSLSVGTKCYVPLWSEKPVKWHDADRACRTRGLILAVVRAVGEREALWQIFNYSGWWSPAFVGLSQTSQFTLNFYLYQWIWSDEVLAYGPNISYTDGGEKFAFCAYMTPRNPHRLSNLPSIYLTAKHCSSKTLKRYFCEFMVAKTPAKSGGRYTGNARPPDLSQDIDQVWARHAVNQCPTGHVTFSFLSCEPVSDCGTQQQQTSCTTRVLVKPRVSDRGKHPRHDVPATDKTHTTTTSGGPPLVITKPSQQDAPTPAMISVTVYMFSCADSTTTVPYSLVCDYVAHCPEKSDEGFCIHAKCPEYTCRSGQCVSFRQKCDYSNQYHCLDRSDEEYCERAKDSLSAFAIANAPPPAVVHINYRHDIYWRTSYKEACPETHFLCSGAESYCMPVFFRCNGHFDCPDREDEGGCDRYTCPGFYRCRDSRICLHAAHFCDVVAHCPQRDDELYCNWTCPAGCLCQGMAFVCTEPFPAFKHPEIRYLDVRGSRMKPVDLLNNVLLIWLSLASCGIGQVSRLIWPNVMHLDLSQNNMDVVNMTMFRNLTNLKTLILAENPLVLLTEGTLCAPHIILNYIDLSRTLLREFNGNGFSCYPYITKLNISQCPLHDIKETAFKSIPYLTTLDLSGSPVFNFPRTIFKALNHLQTVMASNYKLCCAATLPENFNEKNCFAPQDEISSCDDLLRSSLFRGCMWMFAAFTIVGNLSCFLIKVSNRRKTSRSGFSVFVTNLSLSDFLMGVNLVIVGVADVVYRGQYMWYDSQWKTSTACAVAGFLSLLSSEMSAFMICLITVDRFIVLTFPFTDLRFKVRSAAVTCGLVWTVGVVVASVPLFPMTPRWEFYGATGICIPLPITKERFRGYSYSFGVMIVLNFTLFLLIAAGQLSIYCSVRTNSVDSNSSMKPRDLVIAKRLFSVAASDFLCWFPIGLFAVLSAKGVAVSSDVSVAMAIFVMPINSAINPFLYTFNVFVERRRKARDIQLMKTLEKRLLSQTKTSVPETNLRH